MPDFDKALSDVAEAEVFEIAAFDSRAAIELATETRKALDSGNKKGGSEAGWQQVKFDRQIAAIAKAHGAKILYTDDETQAVFARELGLEVKHTGNLSLPEEYTQINLIEDNE